MEIFKVEHNSYKEYFIDFGSQYKNYLTFGKMPSVYGRRSSIHYGTSNKITKQNLWIDKKLKPQKVTIQELYEYKIKLFKIIFDSEYVRDLK